MAVEIRMPQLSDTMETGTIVEWKVQEGDTVDRGDILAEIETDKATMDLEAFDDGVLLKLLYDEGDEVPTQSLIAVVGEEGEDISGILESAEETEAPEAEPESTEEPPGAEAENEPKEEETEQPAEEDETPAPRTEEPSAPEPTDGASEPAPETHPASPQEAPASPPREGERLRVSPVARRMAAENAIDLQTLEGSGPEGRIIKRDVERAIEEGTHRITPDRPSTPERPSPLEAREQKLSGMRKTIASRMTEAKQDVPHFYVESKMAMDRLVKVRQDLSDEETEVSVNDLLLMASARALCDVPRANASFGGDHIEFHDHVHLAFAVAVEDGLFTPVIRKAETKGIYEIHEESQELIQKAHAGDLMPQDYQGGTFTVSNLGMFDVTNFSAIINPPQAAILATGSVREEAVAEDGEVTVGKRMSVTLSCDHRTIDGVVGAKYLQALKKYLENPIRLFSR